MLPDIDGSFFAIKSFVVGLGGLLPAALLSRLLVHRRLVEMGTRRKFWSSDLFWEIPTAVSSAILGSGVALFLQPLLPDAVLNDPDKLFMVTNSIVGVCAFIGPKTVSAMIEQMLEQYSPVCRRRINDRRDNTEND